MIVVATGKKILLSALEHRIGCMLS